MAGSIQFDVWAFDGTDADRFTHVSDQVRGNFPPVARLFPDGTEKADEGTLRTFALNPDYLAAMRHLRTSPGEPLRFIAPKPTESAKTPPVIVENIQGTARALIQPNLIFDTWKRYGS